jgi:hypothetical protein
MRIATRWLILGLVTLSGCATYSPPLSNDASTAAIEVRSTDRFLTTFCILKIDGAWTVPGGALHIKRPPVHFDVPAGLHSFTVQYTSGTGVGTGEVEAVIFSKHRYVMFAFQDGMKFTATLQDETDGKIVSTMQ